MPEHSPSSCCPQARATRCRAACGVEACVAQLTVHAVCDRPNGVAVGPVPTQRHGVQGVPSGLYVGKGVGEAVGGFVSPGVVGVGVGEAVAP